MATAVFTVVVAVDEVGAAVAKKCADCQCWNTLRHLVSILLYLLQLCPKYYP